MRSGSEYPNSRVAWAVEQLRRGFEVGVHSEEEYRQVRDLAEEKGVPFNVGSGNRVTASLVPEGNDE